MGRTIKWQPTSPGSLAVGPHQSINQVDRSSMLLAFDAAATHRGRPFGPPGSAAAAPRPRRSSGRGPVFIFSKGGTGERGEWSGHGTETLASARARACVGGLRSSDQSVNRSIEAPCGRLPWASSARVGLRLACGLKGEEGSKQASACLPGSRGRPIWQARRAGRSPCWGSAGRVVEKVWGRSWKWEIRARRVDRFGSWVNQSYTHTRTHTHSHPQFRTWTTWMPLLIVSPSVLMPLRKPAVVCGGTWGDGCQACGVVRGSFGHPKNAD